MKLKRLINPITGKLIDAYFVFKGDVMYGLSPITWYEKLIFWRSGIKWVKKRAYKRWLEYNSMPRA